MAQVGGGSEQQKSWGATAWEKVNLERQRAPEKEGRRGSCQCRGGVGTAWPLQPVLDAEQDAAGAPVRCYAAGCHTPPSSPPDPSCQFPPGLTAWGAHANGPMREVDGRPPALAPPPPVTCWGRPHLPPPLPAAAPCPVGGKATREQLPPHAAPPHSAQRGASHSPPSAACRPNAEPWLLSDRGGALPPPGCCHRVPRGLPPPCQTWGGPPGRGGPPPEHCRARPGRGYGRGPAGPPNPTVLPWRRRRCCGARGPSRRGHTPLWQGGSPFDTRGSTMTAPHL